MQYGVNSISSLVKKFSLNLIKAFKPTSNLRNIGDRDKLNNTTRKQYHKEISKQMQNINHSSRPETNDPVSPINQWQRGKKEVRLFWIKIEQII